MRTAAVAAMRMMDAMGLGLGLGLGWWQMRAKRAAAVSS